MSSTFIRLLSQISGIFLLGAGVLGSPAQGQDEKGAHRHRPQLAISAAVDQKGDIWTVGLASDQRSLYLQRVVSDGQTSRNQPRSISLGEDKISAAGENRPKLVFGDKWVVITYTQPLSRPYTGEIRMVRSEDGGQTFSRPFTVHQDRQIITHRFESVVIDSTGVLHTFWIDKRDQERVKQERGLSHKEIGKHYRGAAIYRNESKDGGKTFGPDTKVADYSCECCRIAVALDPGGKPVAMWRHVFEPNIRDHAFWGLASRSLTRATFDDWRLDACPHHGPALAPRGAQGFHAVWFGEKAGKAAVRYGQLDLNGKPVTQPRDLPDVSAEHADIVANGQRVVISWRGFDGQRTHWKIWRSDDGGKSFEERTLGRTVLDNDYPILVSRNGQEIWGLWNKLDGLQIEKID